MLPENVQNTPSLLKHLKDITMHVHVMSCHVMTCHDSDLAVCQVKHKHVFRVTTIAFG